MGEYVGPVLSSNNLQYFIGPLSAYVFTLVVVTLVALKLLASATVRQVKNRRLAKEIGQCKDLHWFYGDIVKYPLIKYWGLLNTVKRCSQLPAMCACWIGPFFFSVHVYHPDVVKTILSSSASKKTHLYKKYMGPLLRDGLVTSENDIWRRHRRLLTPIFYFDVLKAHIQVFNDNCETVVERCAKAAEQNNVYDISKLTFDTSFTNMMQCVMSQKSTDDMGDHDVYIDCLKSASTLIFERIRTIWMWNDFLYWHSVNGKKLRKVINTIHDKAKSIIKKRRVLLNAANQQETQHTFIKDRSSGKIFSFKKRKENRVNFLHILLQTEDQHGTELTNDEVLDEVVTFFSAGQETVANGMAWTLYYLSVHPEMQEKCRNELSEVLGNKPDIESNDMPKLVFVTQCIKESLRIMPVIHIISRQLGDSLTLSHRFNDNKKIVLEAGQHVAINIFALHHNPHVWKNPDVFDPERFSSERSADRSSFAFIPFSAGARNCIGQQFAMHQMRVVIGQILRRFQIYQDTDCDAPNISPGATISSSNGIRVKIRSV